MKELAEHLSTGIVSRLQPKRRVDLPSLCDALELPDSYDDRNLSKRQYIKSRLVKLGKDPNLVRRVADKFIRQFPVSAGNEDTFLIEEVIWSDLDFPTISKKLRREIAEGLEGLTLTVDDDGLLEAVNRLWVLESPTDQGLRIFGLEETSNSLRQQIQQNTIWKPGGWSVLEFFKTLGSLECSNKRFARLIESLASSEVCPEESSQRSFVQAVNRVLSRYGLELAETDSIDGYPAFTLQSTGTGATGRPKNLIFASFNKPDLRFRDAVNNDIEIVSHADKVLVYDRPIPDTGLRWKDLQEWWAEINGYEINTAKRSLYKRLLASLPDNSPPQQHLFRTFYKHFGEAIPKLPALLPEVWLHYDPQTVAKRGRAALLRQRMDFLILVSSSTRIVIEVDGMHHYSDITTGKADSEAYAKMVAADRDLRLCGYDVYRFGANELRECDSGEKLLGKFFNDLFAKYNIE